MLPNGRRVGFVLTGPVVANQLPGVGAALHVSRHGQSRFDKQLGPRFDPWAFANHHDVRGIVIEAWVQRQPFDFAALGADVVITTCRSDCQFGGRYP